MKKFIQTLKNIWSIEELRGKILFTMMMIAIYRLGAHIVLPGINPNKMSETGDSNTGILGLIDAFSGGAFNQASIFALGIMPYISASIFMQLMTVLVPRFQKMQKEGESGRKKINQYTRYLTVIVTILQASAYVTYHAAYDPAQWCHHGRIYRILLVIHRSGADSRNHVCDVDG